MSIPWTAVQLMKANIKLTEQNKQLQKEIERLQIIEQAYEGLKKAL